MKSKTCKGCYSFDECGIPYHHGWYEAEKCPCNICLVKVVCRGICDDFRTFMEQMRYPNEERKTESNYKHE